MSIPRDDWRLTAYALGELDDEERRAFEAELEGDHDARAEVERIRQVAAQVAGELEGAEDDALALTDLQRARVVKAARANPALWWAAAAAAVLAGTVWLAADSTREPARGPAGHPDAVLAIAEPASVRAKDEFEEANDRVRTVVTGRENLVVNLPPAPVEDGAVRVRMPEAPLHFGSPPEPVADSAAPVAESWEAPPRFEGRPIDIAATGVELDGLVTGTAADRERIVDELKKGEASAPVVMRYLEVLERQGERELVRELAARYGIPGTEGYARILHNPFLETRKEHTSTFSIDVDRASYANVRRFLLREGRLPPAEAVRIEELINYFPNHATPPSDDAADPFVAGAWVATCPWNPKHRLARISIVGKRMESHERPSSNLVFLLDVSGSMADSNKLPLVKQGLELLVKQLDERDRVGIVTYAGNSSVALPSTPAHRIDEILAVIGQLRAGGSTHGSAGIRQAYAMAREQFIDGGTNRVVLCTDGDFNVGITDDAQLVQLIEQEAKSGVFLSVLGFGTGNLKDARMEELSNHGNGFYAYVDDYKEARKVFAEELTGTLITIAKDVKVQIFFNPARVAGYRLIGYENRMLAAADFNDDRKDAGDIGAGHGVIALYEIVPADGAIPGANVDPNPFVDAPAATEPRTESDTAPDALFRLRLRYKQPDGEESKLIETDVFESDATFESADSDFQWTATVAMAGMLLRGSPHGGSASWPLVLEIGERALADDPGGYRREFLDLCRTAQRLSGG